MLITTAYKVHYHKARMMQALRGAGVHTIPMFVTDGKSPVL